LGAVYAKTARSGEAIELFEKAIELDYYNTEAHFGLANAYLKLGHREEGMTEMEIFKKQREGNITDLEQRVDLVADNPVFHCELAVHYAKQDRHINAINEYKLAIGLDPRNPEYHRLLRASYIKAGRYQEAAREMEIVQRLQSGRE